jgi:hypothetical protein
MRIKVEESDVHGEFHPHDGTTEIYLGGHMTIWGLLDTIIHESLHEAIDNCMEDSETTEKQDHYIIPRLCF